MIWCCCKLTSLTVLIDSYVTDPQKLYIPLILMIIWNIFRWLGYLQSKVWSLFLCFVVPQENVLSYGPDHHCHKHSVLFCQTYSQCLRSQLLWHPYHLLSVYRVKEVKDVHLSLQAFYRCHNSHHLSTLRLNDTYDTSCFAILLVFTLIPHWSLCQTVAQISECCVWPGRPLACGFWPFPAGLAIALDAASGRNWTSVICTVSGEWAMLFCLVLSTF